MPKIKLSISELKRISSIIQRDIQCKKSSLENVEKQEWVNETRKESQISRMQNDIGFQILIKEKIDAETFGKHG